MKRKIISISLKFLTFGLALWGVLLATIDGYMASKTFLYFTNQSNVAIGLVCFVFGVIELVALIKGRDVVIPRWLHIVKFVITVAITLTFLVFWTMIVPVQLAPYPDAFLSMESILCHFLAPMGGLTDWLFERRYQPKKWDFLFAPLMPFVYAIFAIALSMNGVMFSYGERVPYFFLDFYQYGWFTLNNFPFGVVYWMLIVLLMVLGLGWLLIKLNKLCHKGKS